ncbi:MAG: hypothetical protein ABSE51_14760 [Terracidiphilus sp.]|jgi:hypothetical protein
MSSFSKNFTPLIFVTILATALFSTGCEGNVRVYDPYYHDYHEWAPESGYYSQWEHDTHRDHMDFKKRNDADKKAYWDWRHSNDHH